MRESSFIDALFGSFFRWWWALLTGFASLLSFALTPNGITLGRAAFTGLVLAGLTLAFFSASVIFQAWRIYRGYFARPRVTKVQYLDGGDSEVQFLIDGASEDALGKVAELRRPVNGIEVPFALIELRERNSKHQIQARSIWMSSGHRRDLRTGQFGADDILLEQMVQQRTLTMAASALTPKGQNHACRFRQPRRCRDPAFLEACPEP